MNVLKLGTVALGVLLLSAGSAFAGSPVREAGSFGIGLGGGTRTAGISAKYFMSDAMALQGVIGPYYGFGRWANNPDYAGYNDGVMLDADLLFEFPSIYEDEIIDIGWNAGPGAFIGVGEGAVAGANGVLGIEFAFVPVPIDITLEYRPSVLLVPGFGIDVIGFSGHIRYFF